MATNKRKDAAALFELIGKSTLKVPKNAGALKIPNWWSSNSAAGGGVAEMPPPEGKVYPKPIRSSAAMPLVRPLVAEGGSVAAPAEGAGGASEAAVQHRMFDPPPANVAPERTPSIRPPAPAGVPVAVALSTGNQSPIVETTSVEATVGGEVQGAIVEQGGVESIPAVAASAARVEVPLPLLAWESKPKVPAGPRVFAPQTRAQDRTPWSPRPGAFARLPGWIWPTAAGVGLLLIVGVVALAKSMNKPSQAKGKPSPVAEVLTGTTPTLLRGGAAGGTVGPVSSPKMVFYPGEFAHSLELYYIIVCTTPADTSGGQPKVSKAALEYANWLADHGIAVSIELVPTKPGGPLMNMVVSAFGLPSATAAEPYRKQIITIGDKITTGDKLKRGVFKDAHVQNGLSSPGTAGGGGAGSR